MKISSYQEGRRQWDAYKAEFAAKGLILPDVVAFTPEPWKTNANLAMDAAPMQPGPLSTMQNAGIPAMLTTTIDPDVIRVVFGPTAFADILGERKAGDWLEETRMFPVVESTGEVSSYGDFNNNGRSGINMNWPQFQSYLFQVLENYGERELERAGLAKINYVSEIGVSSAELLNRFTNLSYAFGVEGLQNYGIMNNPYLSAPMSPAVKAWGGTTWFDNGAPAATANEVYNDITALVTRAIGQSGGTLDANSKFTLALDNQTAMALQFANSYGVFVKALLKEGYPNLTVKTAPQYAGQGPLNPTGLTGGNMMQLIADKLEGQTVAYAAFNEKLRAHKIVPELSAWRQKKTSGTWGTILRIPAGVVSMVGI